MRMRFYNAGVANLGELEDLHARGKRLPHAIEVVDRILPVEDPEISAFVRKSFEKQGMKILTSAKVQGVRKEGDSLTAVVEAGNKVQEIKV